MTLRMIVEIALLFGMAMIAVARPGMVVAVRPAVWGRHLGGHLLPVAVVVSVPEVMDERLDVDGEKPGERTSEASPPSRRLQGHLSSAA